ESKGRQNESSASCGESRSLAVRECLERLGAAHQNCARDSFSVWVGDARRDPARTVGGRCGLQGGRALRDQCAGVWFAARSGVLAAGRSRLSAGLGRGVETAGRERPSAETTAGVPETAGRERPSAEATAPERRSRPFSKSVAIRQLPGIEGVFAGGARAAFLARAIEATSGLPWTDRASRTPKSEGARRPRPLRAAPG